MAVQDKKWLGGGADIAVRAAFSFGMCGAVAGLLYLTAQNGMTDASKQSQPVPRIATVVATLDQKPQHPETVQAASAAAPLPARPVSQVAAVPEVYAVVPAKRPETREKSTLLAKSGVERFDRCLPDCETRDPMIVGNKVTETRQSDPAPAPASDVAMEEPVDLPIVESAGNFLGRALEVPGDALRKSRSLISSVARATL